MAKIDYIFNEVEHLPDGGKASHYPNTRALMNKINEIIKTINYMNGYEEETI